MATVSLCMIVKNEEAVLERCLDSIAPLVDEIILVDTGSTDHTKEIAARYTDRIYDFQWIDDFAAARNYAFSLATMDFCMWLDADDVLLEQDQKLFQEIKSNLPDPVQVVMMKYHTAFDGQGNPTFSYYRERLIRNHTSMRWEGFVHEAITPMGEVIHSHCAITHRKGHPADPGRNLCIFEKQLQAGRKLEPRLRFYYGRELYYHQRYMDALQVLEAFLLEGNGWVENNLEACRFCAYCYYALDQEQAALLSLLRSLCYDRPRAEICCEIARHFFDRARYEVAACWYQTALTCKRDDTSGGFVSPDCYGYIPSIQLCVCWSRLGDSRKARLFNDLAARLKPDDPAVAHNRQYFETLFQDEAPTPEKAPPIPATMA